MLLEPELSIPGCGCPSSCGGKNALFAQDSLPGRSPACRVLPLPPVPDVLTSPGVLEPPEEPEAAASGECPRRWHGGRAGRWRELQQSCSCLFSLPWFPTSFCANPGCLVPIRVPAGAEGGREQGRVGCVSEVVLVVVPAGSLVGAACSAVPVAGLAPQPSLVST